MTVSHGEHRVTFFAIDPHDPTGKQITLGRGNPDDERSLASDAFASVDTTEPTLHQGVLENLSVAANGQEITRANAAQILGDALELARNPRV